MNNILFDTQYGNNNRVASLVIPSADPILVYYGGSADYSLLKKFPNLKLVLGHNVMLDLDEINTALNEFEASFLKEHLFISDKAFVSFPINKRAKSAYDNKYFGTGYRIIDLHEIRDSEDVEYINRNKNILDCAINLPQFLEKNSESNILFLNTDGAFYDIDTGMYPNIMPYSTTTAGAFEAGLAPQFVNNIIGIVRAYSLYNGKGIMPTEYTELAAPTKRIGRLDLVALRTICKANSVSSLILTDLSSFDSWDKIEVCIGYKNYDYYPTDFESAIPDYKIIDGWKTCTQGMTKINQLPVSAREFILLIESYCEVMVDLIDLENSFISRWDYWS